MNPTPASWQASSTSSEERSVEVVAVLDAHHVDDLARLLELLDRDVGDPDVADLPLVLELLECADRFLVGDLVVRRVQLIEVDAVDLQPPEAPFAGLPQVLGPPVARPLSRPGTGQAALGGDHEPVRVGMKRFGDQVLAHLRPIRVGGVDQIDSSSTTRRSSARAESGSSRRPPDAVARDAHCSEAEAAHLEVAADLERVHASPGTGKGPVANHGRSRRTPASAHRRPCSPWRRSLACPRWRPYGPPRARDVTQLLPIERQDLRRRLAGAQPLEDALGALAEHARRRAA